MNFSWIFENKLRFFLALAILTFGLRISTLYHPFIDIDESQFAGFAHVLMDGGLPYRDSLDTKPPLIYLFYACCFFIFGKYNMAGVHLAGIVLALAVSWTLYQIGKENGQEKGGMGGALFYTLFSTAGLPKFIAVSITSVMVLPLSLSLLYFLRGDRESRLRFDLWAGLFVGLAFLFKYQSGIQLVLFFLWIIWSVKQKEEDLRSAFLRFSTCFGGFLIPVMITGVSLYALGVWSDFYQWSLLGSFRYIQSGVETISYFKNFFLRGGFFILCTLVLWVLASFQLKNNNRNRLTLFLGLGLLLSWVPVATGGRFYGHYFIQCLPPLCLLAGLQAGKLERTDILKKMAWGIFLPVLFFWVLRLDLKKMEDFFPDDQLFLQKRVGEWMKNNTQPQETLFVWGFATAIYFHAERKPVSRFLWTDWLTGKVPGSNQSNLPDFDTTRYIAPLAWKALWEDFNKNPPTYFVDTSPPNIHNYKKYPLFSYPELYSYLQTHYRFWKNVEGCAIYKKRM